MLRDAVRILVERMRSHPDEFNSGGRFFWIIQAHTDGRLDFLTEAERQAFKQVLDAMRYEAFHNTIFSSVLEARR